MSYENMYLHQLRTVPCLPNRPSTYARVQVTARAASGAVLCMPTSEASLSRQCAPSLRDHVGTRTGFNQAEPLMPTSSGLDFIDLVGLDDSTVWHRLQDAVTYRILVGECPAKELSCRAARTDTFNIKQLKMYRDNVTRNLAPTVARGFANAARATGHVISTTDSSAPASGVAQPAEPLRTAQPRPLATPQVAPPPSQLRSQQEAVCAPSTGSAEASSPGESPHRQAERLTLQWTPPAEAAEAAGPVQRLALATAAAAATPQPAGRSRLMQGALQPTSMEAGYGENVATQRPVGLSVDRRYVGR